MSYEENVEFTIKRKYVQLYSNVMPITNINLLRKAFILVKIEEHATFLINLFVIWFL